MDSGAVESEVAGAILVLADSLDHLMTHSKMEELGHELCLGIRHGLYDGGTLTVDTQVITNNM